MTETPQQTQNPNVGRNDEGPNFGEVDPDRASEIQREQDEERPRGDYLTREEVEKLLAERDQRNAEALAQARAGFPQSQVPAHAGGPGVDRHQRSWSLAEQELSQRGETLDHWEG